MDRPEPENALIATGSTNGSPSRGQVKKRPRIGYTYLHCAVDDHSRVAYVEAHDNEQAATLVEFWGRAQNWFWAKGMADEFLYSFTFRSENERRRRLDRWVHNYNHHRNHTAIGGPPASRVHNVCGYYTQLARRITVGETVREALR